MCLEQVPHHPNICGYLHAIEMPPRSFMTFCTESLKPPNRMAVSPQTKVVWKERGVGILPLVVGCSQQFEAML